MIEKWLIIFVLGCFVWMILCAAILHDIIQIGKDHINRSEENGEEE